MLLVQKIFYFHVPAWIAMYCRHSRSAASRARSISSRRPAADRVAVSAAELIVLFGAIGLVTGPLWGRKAWGVWWQWDARLTMALLLELIFIAYLLVRKYGGPGIGEARRRRRDSSGWRSSPFVYVSVNIWRTIHPTNTVVPTLAAGDARRVLVLRARVPAAVRACC